MYVHSGTDSLISQETLQNYVILHHLTTADSLNPTTFIQPHLAPPDLAQSTQPRLIPPNYVTQSAQHHPTPLNLTSPHHTPTSSNPST